jgi:hypothetical protein
MASKVLINLCHIIGRGPYTGSYWLSDDLSLRQLMHSSHLVHGALDNRLWDFAEIKSRFDLRPKIISLSSCDFMINVI